MRGHEALAEVHREEVLEPVVAPQRRDLRAAQEAADAVVIDAERLAQAEDDGLRSGVIEVDRGAAGTAPT